MCVCGGGVGDPQKYHKNKLDIMVSIGFNSHANKVTEIGKFKFTEVGRENDKEQRNAETDFSKDTQMKKGRD